ncbi:tetratricopeptide repeat 28-like, partial [Paramuricea clavata]
EHQKAIAYQTKSLEISTAIGDRSEIAKTNCNLGNAYYNLREYQKAIDYHKNDLEISIIVGNRSGIARSNGNLGIAYNSLGEYQKAIDYQTKSLEISTALNDRSEMAKRNCNLGNVCYNSGKYQKAIDYHQKHLELSTAIGDRSGIAGSSGNLGNAYNRLGEYETAIDYHKKDLEISTAIGDRSGIAQSSGNLGNVYDSLGEYETAIDYHKKDLEISTAIGDRSGIARSNGNLGNAYRSLGEYQKAIDYQTKSLEISTAVGDRSRIARSNGNLGNVYHSLGDYQNAIDCGTKSLEISTAIGDRSGIARSNGNLGNAYYNLGEYSKAIDYLKKDLEISTAIGNGSGIARSSGNLGIAYYSLGEYQKAIDYQTKSLEISTAIGDRSRIAMRNCNLGNAYYKLGEYLKAIDYFKKDLEINTAIGDRSGIARSNGNLGNAYHSVGEYRKAFDYQTKREYEVARSHLMESIGVFDRIFLNFVPDQNKLMFAKEYCMFHTVLMSCFLLLNRVESALLVIDLGRSKELHFCIEKRKNDTSILLSDARRETVLLLIKEILTRIDVHVDENSSFYNGEAGSLPLKLTFFQVDPVKDLVKGNKLIVVPDPLLFFVPFSALIRENGLYLSNKYSVQISPSLHTLKCTTEQSYDPNIGFGLFVGNPDVGKVSLNGKDFAPIDLPGAAEEVKCLSKHFEANSFVGRAATKQRVLQHLSWASIIHIAAHGDPKHGEIMLAPNSSPTEPCSSLPKPETYLLTQRDILNTSVQARLVVLSCCYTGKGEITSEGVIGITRAFLSAGARCVLATLWPILNDYAAKEFMEKFYEFLQGVKEVEQCKLGSYKTVFVNTKCANAFWNAFRTLLRTLSYGPLLDSVKEELLMKLTTTLYTSLIYKQLFGGDGNVSSGFEQPAPERIKVRSLRKRNDNCELIKTCSLAASAINCFLSHCTISHNWCKSVTPKRFQYIVINKKGLKRLEEVKKSFDNYKKSRIATSNSNLGIAYLSLREYQKAIDYHKKDLEISTAIGDRSGIARSNGIATSNCNLGSAYSSSGEYQKAIDYHKRHLEISIAIGDRSGIRISNCSFAKSNCNLGDAYHSLGEYQKAIDYHKKDLEISTVIGDRSGIAKSNANLGVNYRRLGEYQKAIDYHKKDLEISTAIGDRSGIGRSNANLGIARSNCNLGNAYHSLGEYQKSIDYHKKHLEISIAIGDRSEIAKSNCNLGNAYHSLGEYQKAIDYHKKDLEISTVIGDRSGIARSNGNLGNTYCSFGEYQNAIDYHKKHLEISTAIGDRSGIGKGNCNLGIAYDSIGEYQKAIECHNKHLEISTAIGDRWGIGTSNCNLGIAYDGLGEYQKAIECHNKHLEISTAIGDRSGIRKSNSHLGIVYDHLEEYQKAIDRHKNNLEISIAIGDPSGIARSNGNLGNAYYREYGKAIDCHKKSLEISTAIGDRSGMGFSYCNLGNAYNSLGEYQKAVDYYKKDLEISTAIGDRSGIAKSCVPEQNQLAFVKQYFDFHRILMSCFLSLERAEPALLVIDLGRCKELHFCIEKRRNSVDMGLFDYALFAFDLEDVLYAWVLADKVIFRKVLDGRRETFVLLIMELLGRVDVSIDRNSSFYRLYSVANTNNQVMSPFEFRSRQLSSKNAVESSASYSNFSDRNILEMLFQLLVDPVKDLIRGNNLIIVPDPLLFFTPFSALIDENGAYLSNIYSVQISPSLHTLQCTMEQSFGSNFGFALFVGNPTVGKVSLNGKDVTPADLPNAAEEVKCLSTFFKARPLLEREATKQVVLQLLTGASIIHIAAHGEPTRGEIMLAQILLLLNNILNISVQARLVVLCCCHTGQGKITSEGVIGITRAFLAAGARCVVATLWPISDYATKEFMEKFYGELCQETPVCEALRRTMNFFQKHEKEEYRSSWIWAPFSMYGEDV